MTRKEVAGLSKLEINSVYQGDCLELMKNIADGSVDMNNPTLKDAYNKQVLAMMNRAAIRNQSYKETGTITTLAGQERWSEFQQQAEMKAAETQAELDQNAYFKQHQLYEEQK